MVPLIPVPTLFRFWLCSRPKLVSKIFNLESGPRFNLSRTDSA